ncbi:AraC family transcriptional regulator [Bradyrhizobium diazoefficiens]|nr:AraC family transcriptional regulator [Bradyrhizobium diazoefficiens]MBR0851615.1 AraC family transcriptional regulator [Bradyrhizobium diazoefficiens]
MLPSISRRFLPLAGDFEFCQGNLQLGDLRLVVEKRPPCASNAHLDQGQIGIAMSMGESAGLALDGLPLNKLALVNHGCETPHHIFHRSKLTIAAVFLPNSNVNRGWPERAKAAKASFIEPMALQQLQAVVRDVVCLASRDPLFLSRQNVVSGMRQSLLGALDHAFLTAPGESQAGLAISNYIRICRIAEEFIGSRGRDFPSNGDVAAAAGATVRTLHNAMVAVNGMSLRKFMALRRLWSVHAALMRAGPRGLVKTIAIDHGFWHLGNFSQTYRAFFGESPSDTLARSKA